MLRGSANAARHPLDLRAVPAPDVDPGIPGGRQLLDFTDALLNGRDIATLDQARGALVDAVGPDGAARAAMVTGNFEMMNRVLDATGVPISVGSAQITAELGLPPFTGRQ